MSKSSSRQARDAQIDQILRQHSLKKTSLRRQILDIFIDSDEALSQGKLIEQLTGASESVDRVSVYRNLVQLKEAGVLHEAEPNQYVFCSHECDLHPHLLLFCQSCSRHKEIKDHDRIEGFMENLGKFRFFDRKQPISLRGLCASCSSKAAR